MFIKLFNYNEVLVVNEKVKKKSIFAFLKEQLSSFFLKLFLIPYGTWFLLSLFVLITDKTSEDPLTFEEFLYANVTLFIIWFIISFIISLIVNKIKKVFSRKHQYQNSTNNATTILNEKDLKPEKVKSNKKIIYHKPKFIRISMIILFILTIASLWFALSSVSFIDKIIPQHGFNFTKNMWVFWCWLPIPILSIILGFKYKAVGFKCTKNIVGGFIMGFLLLAYGAFCLFPTFSQDYSEIDNYRPIIDAKLPKTGDLEIQEWGTYFDEDKTEYVIINAYYDNEDVSELINSITNSNNWMLSKEIKSELKIFIPSQLRSDNDAYFSIYNKTLNEYNTIPSNSGIYEFYTMKYDKSDKHLEIHKFKYSYK